MADANPADLEKRLDAGEWLTVMEVTALLRQYRPHLNRATVHRWVIGKKIRVAETPTGKRTCDPRDVRKILDGMRQAAADT